MYIYPQNKSIYNGFLFMAVILLVLPGLTSALQLEQNRTIAIWLFDEQEGLYPSKVLHDVGPNEYIMSLGRSGYIVPGKFGHALEIGDARHIDFPTANLPEKFGLFDYDIPEGRTVKPMNWQTAKFAAMMTSGERHLRRQVGFPQATMTGLNLGSVFHWTVEFWYQPIRSSSEEGVIFEIGQGPRGEKENRITRLVVNADGSGFTFYNEPGNVELHIPSLPEALDHREGKWHHMAFVYDAAEAQVYHYVDGKQQTLPDKAVFRALDRGQEDYFVLGTDVMWGRALPGRLDEVRFSYGKIYQNDFAPPGSFSQEYLATPPSYKGLAGPPLLFAEEQPEGSVLDLGNRRHLFIDDALLDEFEGITFTLNAPKVDRRVIHIEGLDEGIPGQWERFRKHLNVLEDEDGLIRIYSALDDEHLAVFISRDGVNFESPDLGRGHKGRRNIVVPEPVGTGTVIIDPNAPPSDRWKYITGYHRRGVYVYTSPDGFNFRRYKQALLPFRGATQNDVIYDDQRQQYIGYWRSGFARTENNYTRREFVMSLTNNIIPPMYFRPVTAEETHAEAQIRRLSEGIPWYLDNGPFTPGKFGIEFPAVFGPDDDIDGLSAGVYNPKAMKYPWAPDTYIAFPVFYFHYYEGYPGRQALYTRRGGGPTESQFAASRDGITWKRYPRPAYVGLGRYNGLDVVQNYISPGMIRRGDEIWQYVFVDNDYHTARDNDRTRRRAVYRLIQRLDGFVSIDSPYDRYATIVSKPVTFTGNRLVLNINTDAQGYAYVAFLDEDGKPIEGYTMEESVMINGNHTNIEVEWIKSGLHYLADADSNPHDFASRVEVSSDVSELAGRPVRVKIQMRGSKLYALQFKDD